ncbi:hypothetical protein A1F94_001070 [Pyrenophora tritici-repentis]|nr:hypothetical protein A1F99_016900 [Pyrenophora tritici-repentis]KAF7577552.1 hypothetical protein PtrM4_017920 [Pyrenophora tritici-repentis]KAG9388178.1 hypothetical protein A1F94_001070 [Pyrenophora tritici-repentis]KAI1563731.1 hypothetical protein PtrEW4_009239 [Pyrenophora tritici-repentis]
MEPSRDTARRVAEEDELDSSSPPPPPLDVETPPRSAPRRRLSTRDTPPNVKRGSLFGIFGRSKTETASPTSKPTRSSTRARANTMEGLVKVSRRELETDRPSSRDHSSNESRERTERPHRSRRHSHAQRRQFASPEEEADYYKWKEERRYMRRPEHEMSGGRDGGMSVPQPVDDLPPPPPEPFEYEMDAEVIDDSPIIEDSAGVVGVPSISDEERRQRRRSRRPSKLEERPKTRRISVTEKERPSGRRVESDRPRTRDRGEERPRPKRGETERRDRRKKKEESSGLKGLLGGLKRRIA